MQMSKAHWDELVPPAGEDAPNECCGDLRAEGGEVKEIVRSRNLRASPYGYELDAESLLAANQLDGGGHGAGICHAPPRSPAEPSQTDVNVAYSPHWIYVIVSLDGEPRGPAWRI